MPALLQNRRVFLRSSLLFAGAALGGSAEACLSPTASALQRAWGWLGRRQEADGSWRSSQYPAFRRGDVLTPLILWGLRGSAGNRREAEDRGAVWLQKLTARQAERSQPWEGLEYPLFTAGYAAQFFAAQRDGRRAAFWADVIDALRTSPELGWPKQAAACGAWGDAPAPPRIPHGQTPPDMLSPNLSATVLALQGLVAAGRADSASKALPFVASCHNFVESGRTRYDDGGFFFCRADPVRNKAGSAGRDDTGCERFKSYGSATCDGLLALRACGVEPGTTQYAAVLGWLQRHAAGVSHGGEWTVGFASERESLKYYYAQAFAAVLGGIPKPGEARGWATSQRAALVSGLVGSQASDGSWRNVAPDSFEDDPLVATSFAVRALSLATGPS